jgi:hypothetical protein
MGANQNGWSWPETDGQPRSERNQNPPFVPRLPFDRFRPKAVTNWQVRANPEPDIGAELHTGG